MHLRARLDDASDLLSPILVKEFRQGVRGHIFTGAFLLLHGLLVLSITVGLIDVDVSVLRGTFWTLLFTTIGILVPLSGLGAISHETTLKTLEPMLLTRLSPRAIVLGKWASLLVQTLILGVSVAPYLLVRYFVGGLDFGAEAAMAAHLLLAAAVYTALTVGLSALRISALFRWAGAAAAMIALWFLMFIFFTPRFGGSWSLGAPALAFGLGLLTVVVMIEAGASQIAPEADRSSAVSRAAMLLWLPIAGFFVGTPRHGGALHVEVVVPATAIWTGLLLGLVVIASLCEAQSRIPGVYAPFFARSPLHRLLGWVLSPGWAAGVIFTALMAAGACAAVARLDPVFADPRFLLAVEAALLLPVPLMRLIPAERIRPPLVYVAAQVLSLGVGALPMFADLLGFPLLAALGGWLLPLSPVLQLATNSAKPELMPEPLHWLCWGVSIAIVTSSLAYAVDALRRTERLVRDRTAPKPNPEDAAPPAPSAASAA